jgi:hypothetical protein
MTRQTITQRLAGSGGPRRRTAAAAGAIVVVAAAIGVVISAGAPASSKGQGSTTASTGATAVQHRDLVQTDTESGTLGYANAQTVFNRLSGTITYLPNVGQVVSPGGTLYQVDGYPVILFTGSYPAYRSLTSGDSNGPDIKELNADLKAMGFDPYGAITVDDVWQVGTTAAVERFQGSIGQTESGTISLGQIVFLPGPQLINAVDTTMGSTGGSAGTGTGTGTAGSGSGAANSNPTSSATNASYQPTGQAHPEFVDLTTSSAATAKPAATAAATTPTMTTPAPTTTTPTTTTPTPTTTTPGPTTPMSGTPSSSTSSLEAIIQLLRTQNKLLQAQLKAAAKSAGTSGKSSSGAGTGSAAGSGSAKSGGSASPGGASSSGGGSGTSGSGTSGSGTGSGTGSGAGSSATAILSTTSTKLVVTVDLDATKQSEAKLHEPVTVQLPDGTTVNGRITGVSPVATTTSTGSSSSSPSNSAPSATIPVTISLDRRANTRGLDQAAVSVNFAQQVANNVLSVPVTALLATQGGGYAVQLAAPPHRLIPVTPGLFAAGYVQISGPQVQDGMQVTDSQG